MKAIERRARLLVSSGIVAVAALAPAAAQTEPTEPSDDSRQHASRTASWLQVDADASRIYIKVAARGFGHSHAVVGRVLASSRLRLDRTEGPGAEADRLELSASIKELDEHLDTLGERAAWRRYLQVREVRRMVASRGPEISERAALFRVVGKFETLDRDPRYASLTQQAAFQDVMDGLPRYVAPGGMLVFDMRSFEADTDEARRYLGLTGQFSTSDRQEINGTMRGPEVLDVARHPRATFLITGVRAREGGQAGAAGAYGIEGVLVLRGVSRAVSIAAQVERETEDGGALRMQGRFALRQTDYGITPYSAFFGTVSVADRLEIHGDLVLVPEERARGGDEGPAPGR